MKRRKFIKAGALFVPAYLAGISGIIRAGSAPSLNVAGTARVGTVSRPAAGGGGGPAVAFDTQMENGSDVATSPFTASGTIASNSNRVLIAAAIWRNVQPTGVTMDWNTTESMTQIDFAELGTGDVYRLYLFGLIAPSTGTHNLRVQWTGGASTVALGAVSLYNAHQTTAWQNNGDDSGTSSPASSTITTADGNMAVAAHYNNNGSSTAISAGTSAWIESDLNGNYAMGYQASDSASEVITWTFTGAVQWGNIKCDVIKA